MAIHPFKDRKLEVRFAKDAEHSEAPEYPQQKIEQVNRAEDIQETVRIVSSHVILGVGTYVLLDTFRKAVVKMVPGR